MFLLMRIIFRTLTSNVNNNKRPERLRFEVNNDDDSRYIIACRINKPAKADNPTPFGSAGLQLPTPTPAFLRPTINMR